MSAADDTAAGREDWMTTPMGRSVAAAPAGDGKSDKQQAAADRAAIAAVNTLCIICGSRQDATLTRSSSQPHLRTREGSSNPMHVAGCRHGH